MGLKDYIAPRSMVIEVKAHGVLCDSPYADNTEKFTLSGSSYGDSDWN